MVHKILYSHTFINSSNFAKYTSGLSAFEQDHKIEKNPCIKLMNLGILYSIQFIWEIFYYSHIFFPNCISPFVNEQMNHTSGTVIA